MQFPPGNVRAGGVSGSSWELLKKQTQDADCQFIPVGELPSVLGSLKIAEPDSHKFFKGLQSVLFPKPVCWDGGDERTPLLPVG